MAFVSDILREKGTKVHCTTEGQSIVEAADWLKDRGIGALVVTSDGKQTGKVIGIVSERDIVYGIGIHGNSALEKTVSDYVSREVQTCKETDTVNEAKAKMVDHRLRHLPVMEGDELKGLVSIRDVAERERRDLQALIAKSQIFDPAKG